MPIHHPHVYPRTHVHPPTHPHEHATHNIPAHNRALLEAQQRCLQPFSMANSFHSVWGKEWCRGPWMWSGIGHTSSTTFQTQSHPRSPTHSVSPCDTQPIRSQTLNSIVQACLNTIPPQISHTQSHLVLHSNHHDLRHGEVQCRPVQPH